MNRMPQLPSHAFARHGLVISNWVSVILLCQVLASTTRASPVEAQATEAGVRVTSPAITAGGCRCKNGSYGSITYPGQYLRTDYSGCFVPYPDPPVAYPPIVPMCIVDPDTCTGYAAYRHARGYYFDYCFPGMNIPKTKSGCSCHSSYTVFCERTKMWLGVVGCITTYDRRTHAGGRNEQPWCRIDRDTCPEGAEPPGQDWDWCADAPIFFDTYEMLSNKVAGHFGQSLDPDTKFGLVRMIGLSNPAWMTRMVGAMWSNTCYDDDPAKCLKWLGNDYYHAVSLDVLDAVDVVTLYNLDGGCVNCSFVTANYPDLTFDPLDKEMTAALPRFTMEGIDFLFATTIERPHITCKVYFCTFGSAEEVDPTKVLSQCTSPYTSHWQAGVPPVEVLINMQELDSNIRMSKHSVYMKCDCRNIRDCKGALEDTSLELFNTPWSQVNGSNDKPLAHIQFSKYALCDEVNDGLGDDDQGSSHDMVSTSCSLRPIGPLLSLWKKALTMRYSIQGNLNRVLSVDYVETAPGTQHLKKLRPLQSFLSWVIQNLFWLMFFPLVALTTYCYIHYQRLRRRRRIQQALFQTWTPRSSSNETIHNLPTGPPSPFADFNWHINPMEVTMCKKADGSEWVLGQGAFGKVYKGQWNNGMEVAVKVLNGVDMTAADRMHIEKEISILRSCRSPYIVQFLGANFAEECSLIITELMSGGDLHKAIGNRAISWHKRGSSVALNIAQGLHYLHQHNVLHLDVKSPNILLSREGVAKVGDVGLAHIMATQYATQGQGMKGTWGWMAPEVINGVSVTLKADVYSFGIVLWEIMTGERPRRGMLRRPTEAEGPAAAADLIQRCTDFDPHNRPTMQEVLEQLQALDKEVRRHRSGSRASSETDSPKRQPSGPPTN